MKQKFLLLKKDQVFSISSKFFILMIICSFVLILVKWSKIPSEVPLFYSLPWGKQQLGSAFSLFLLPLFSLLVFSINSLLATVFFQQEEPLISRLLILLAIFVDFLALFTLLKIVFLIT